MFRHIFAAFKYRHFIVTAIRSDFRARVARSKIGTLWLVLHPLAMALIYALILSEVLGAKIGGVDNQAGYAVYLLAGVSVWGLFQELLNRCITIFIEYGNTLKKISFPRICLPIIALGGALVNHVLLLVAVACIIAFYGFYPTMHWLELIGVVLITSSLALGFGILLGVMNVFARDVGQVMIVVMNIWFWLTPIVYTVEMVPDSIASFMAWNPMAPIAKAFQDVILFRVSPDWPDLIYPLVLGLTMLMLSLFVFRRASPELVDAL